MAIKLDQMYLKKSAKKSSIKIIINLIYRDVRAPYVLVKPRISIFTDIWNQLIFNLDNLLSFHNPEGKDAAYHLEINGMNITRLYEAFSDGIDA